jgi:hypothetical protein
VNVVGATKSFNYKLKKEMLKKNVGAIDKVIRTVLAVLISVLFFTHTITGTLGIVLMILATISLITLMISICPIYLFLRLTQQGKANKPFRKSASQTLRFFF